VLDNVKRRHAIDDLEPVGSDLYLKHRCPVVPGDATANQVTVPRTVIEFCDFPNRYELLPALDAPRPKDARPED
jgi:hypothetical protein